MFYINCLVPLCRNAVPLATLPRTFGRNVSGLNLANVKSKRLVSYKTSSVPKLDSIYDQSKQHDKEDIHELEQSEINYKLYSSHIPLSYSQKVALSVGSAFMALADPYRDDMVATFGETTGYFALQKMHQNMLQNEEGLRILEQKPRINSQTIDIEKLGTLPSNTFGYGYYRFLTDNKVSPDTRKEVRFVDDVELAYVMQRYREVHDLVHTLLQMPTNMLGEVLVKWVEAIQTDLPLCWLGGLFGATRLNSTAKHFYLNGGLRWALKCGHEANDLMCVFFEERFEQDFDELRTELNIPTPPNISKLKSR